MNTLQADPCRPENQSCIEPNFCIIALTQTDQWVLPPQLMRRIKAIEGIYVFNRAAHINCCELTPSYWLRFIENRAALTDKLEDCRFHDKTFRERRRSRLAERVRDNIHSVMMETGDEDGIYVHVHTVESLINSFSKAQTTSRFREVGNPFHDEWLRGELTADQIADKVRENHLCNNYL